MFILEKILKKDEIQDNVIQLKFEVYNNKKYKIK